MIILARNTVLISMFVMVQLIPSVSLAENQKLKLEIGLSKQTYLLRETIWLDVTLTNVGVDTTRVVHLDPPCQGGVGIELRDSLGKEMSYTGPSILLAPREGFNLEPKEQYYDCFDLIELFSTYRSLLGVYFGLLPQGKYEVQARYREALSQKLTFEIVEPTGAEGEALLLFEEGMKLILRKQPGPSTEKLNNVTSQFPSSVYAEKAYRELFQRNELVREFPNSGYNKINLIALTRKLGSRGKREFLENIIRDHPETRNARFARQMLKEWGK